jgi:hypothetical protein
MEKFVWMLIATIAISFQVNGQLVIDSSSASGYYIPFRDTTLSSISPSASCSSTNFPLDLNGDSNIDVEFLVSCSMGGQGSMYSISIKTFNDFQIHSDTNYIEYYQYIAPGGAVHDTTRKRTVVQKYSWGDLIQGGQTSLSSNLPIYSYATGNFPSCIYTNIEPVLLDTFYIAVETPAHDIYCFKLSNPSRYELRIFSVKSSVNQLQEDIIIFPNPSSGTLYFNKPCDLVEIYSIDGKLVKSQADVYETLDVSGLSNGTYWMMVDDGGTMTQTKFVKVTL